MTENKRQYPRYAVEAVVEITGDQGVVSGRSQNVSQGGFCAMVDAPVTPGDMISAKLSLVFDEDSFSEPLVLPARVAWCTELDAAHQLGCAFSNLTDDQSRYLQMFLRFLESDAGDQAEEPDPFS